MALITIKTPHKKNEEFHLSLKKLLSLFCSIPPIINDGNKNKAEINKDEHKKNIPVKKNIYLYFSNLFLPKNEKLIYFI